MEERNDIMTNDIPLDLSFGEELVAGIPDTESKPIIEQINW